MPTYQYACTACGHRFDAVQSFTDSTLTECPECTGRLRKVFSSVGIVFKGSGFYRTDSRTDSRAGNGRVDATSGSSDKSADSGSGSSSDSGSGSGSSGSSDKSSSSSGSSDKSTSSSGSSSSSSGSSSTGASTAKAS